MKRYSLLIALSSLVLMAGACELKKSENPLSPSVAGPIAGVEISAPKPLEPASGWQMAGDKQPLTLLIENASSTGQRPLNYLVEIASDAAFANKVFSRDNVQPGSGGRTTLTLPAALASGRAYYWRAKAQDGANSGPYSAGVSFTLVTPVSFDKPGLISPVGNGEIDSLRAEFRFNNAPRAGTPTGVSYAIQVSTNGAFSNSLAVWQYAEQPNQTKVVAGSDLPPGTQIFWHARASAGGVVGPWSDTGVFRTPIPVVIDVPPSGPASTASCSSPSTEMDIVRCHRAQYGHMSAAQTNQFLRAVAADLNKGNFGGGYGIYPKSGGNQCNGYSCDIICTNTRVWDVLGNWEGSQDPMWLYKGTNTGSCQVIR
jgi:hypothetical protein